ncbi:MAG TPA: PepSY domain-containing protein [Rhizomicrobium sp.]|nr:PepSY domain-containing protein [Rhizomicrobium sp.]
MMHKTRILALTAVLALAAPVAYADENSSNASSSSSSRNGNTQSSSSSNRDQDDAREALRLRRAMPLTAILEIAFKRERGTVLEVELETDDGMLIYQIELLSEAGRKVKMWINARTGELRRVRYP